MSIAALIRSMADAGAPAEAIALAVEAIENAQGALDRQREAARDRKRRQRANGQDESVTVTGQSRDTDATVTDAAPSLSPPPQTPPPHTHPREEITTRTRALARADDFETWWTAYPAKIGKKAARRAWDAAKDRPDLMAMLDALERYRTTKPPDRDWCHPTTWLSQGRWDDDAPAPQVIPMRPTNGKPDKFAARHDNYAASWSGADQAVDLLAARRAL